MFDSIGNFPQSNIPLETEPGKDWVYCNECGCEFPDIYPSGRCPFEYDHNSEDEEKFEGFTLDAESQGVTYTGPNPLGTTGDPEYPTVIYTFEGEPKAFSALSFVGALRFAIAARDKFADKGVALIFTDSGWNI